MKKTKGYTLVTIIVIMVFLGAFLGGIVPLISQNFLLGIQRLGFAQAYSAAQAGIMDTVYQYRLYGKFKLKTATLISGIKWIAAKDQANFVLIGKLDSKLQNSNRELIGWSIKNIHSSAKLQLYYATISWRPAAGNERVTRIWIGNQYLWNGSAKSGTKINIKDYTFNPGTIVNNNKIQFNKDMSTKTIYITLHLRANAMYDTTIFPPAAEAELQLKATGQAGQVKRSIKVRYGTVGGEFTEWEEVNDHY